MVYFDCSELSLDDGSPLSETLPCGYDASWRHFGTQFWWSCLVWGILWLFCAFFGRIWSQNKVGECLLVISFTILIIMTDLI